MTENLITMQELKRQLKQLQSVSLLLSKEKRKQLQDLEQRITEDQRAIDLFHRYFSDRGWCVYDSMSLKLIKSAVEKCESEGIDAGEDILLHYYTSDVKEIIFHLKSRSSPFMERYDQILKAFEDHFSERYYASIPQFLIIIDGAVNDYTQDKGFFAEGTDVTAWDCLVGDNEGLAKIKAIINKSRKKTNHEEIRLPYRNGIFHGRDINYGNVYVSCKCVSLMFAVADWIHLKNSETLRKEKFEASSRKPSLAELWKQVSQTKIDQERINNWKRRTVVIGKSISENPTLDDCAEYPYLVPLLKAFHAWKTENYGDLSEYFKNLFKGIDSHQKRAGECRKLFFNKHFVSFKLLEIEERGCSLTRILVQVNWMHNNALFSEPLEFGCAYRNSVKNSVSFPWKGDGEWTLLPWKVQGLYKEY